VHPDQRRQRFPQAIHAAHADVVASDGATHRGSHDRPDGRALHPVSASATNTRRSPHPASSALSSAAGRAPI
jgi:hypothetical protein